MSIDPHVIWSERFEQIGSLIEANAEVLTGRWSEQALQEQRDASAAHYDEMHNRLPEFLREMGRALSQTDSTVPRPHAMLALAHGEQRWHIGWNLGEVVCDFQILRLVVLEYLDTCLEKPLTTREVMAIGLALDEGISASVMAYVGHQENALREANSRLTEFLPVLGHELRNPLSAVVGAMELINLSRVQDEVLREAHKIVERQVHQIIRLVDDMLDISRIMRGQLAVRAELLDVRKIVQEAGDLHRPLFSERDQTLTLSLPKEPLWIRADPGRLRQVLTNLLNNAMKYTEPKGQIVVDADKRDDRIVISVRDTGVGIQEDLLPGIFDMFAQGPQHKHQGLGIGLALVRALVQTHGGTIKATSAGPGKGSEFTIELPEARQEVPQSEPASSVEKHPAKAAACYRILLVDDHQDGAHTLAVLLERNGHEVRLAREGREALDIALRYKPDVILIDIGLPDIDGYEVAQTLRQHDSFANTTLIAISGYATDNDRDRARQATFDHHLAKPVELEALQTLLGSFRRRR